MKSSPLSLPALMVAQAQVVFNDNAAKFMLIALAQFPGVLAAGTDVEAVRSWLGAILVAPFVLFAPVSGWASDRFTKWGVLNFALGLQVAVMLLLVWALWMQSLLWAGVCFFLLAVQTTIFAPAKRGILLEIVGEQKLSRAVGIMEMLSVTAILVGGYAGGRMFDTWTVSQGGAWEGALRASLYLTVACVVSWGVFQLVQRTTLRSDQPFKPSLLWCHLQHIGEVYRNRLIWRATLGIVFFYGVGGYFLLLLSQMGAAAFGGGVGSATLGALMMLLLGVGTMVGNLLAGLLSRRGVEMGLAPIGGGLLFISLVMLAAIGAPTTGFKIWLAVAGFSSGFFLVPLFAYVQQMAGDDRRGRILASVGLLDSLAGLAASGLFWTLASESGFGWGPTPQLLVLAGITVLMIVFALRHLPHDTLCTVMRSLGPLFYRVRSRGAEHIPAGGALMICNHLSYVDAVVLQIASPRPLRFFAFGGDARTATVRFLLRAAGMIPLSPDKPLKGIRQAVDAIKRGELVCVFPEGSISRTGQLMRLKSGFETIARQARAPVVPAVLDGLWGSVFSFAGNKYLWKSPRLMPTPVFVEFGAPIPPAKADLETCRRALLDLGESAFQERPVLKRHLGRECVRALAKRPGHVEVIDRTADRREVKAAQLLAAAAALSRRIKATVPDQRVGIVLPPGAGAHIANLAVACAGKVPVNLNFTVGRAAVEAAFRIGEIRTVITADAMKAKIAQFPFPEDTRDLRKEIEAAGGKKAMLPWLLAAWLLPNQWVADLLGLPREGDREEAGLLFTSGSSGEPKGVVLTHRNILANCAQISSLSILPDSSRIMACLPIFHSFGFTVTLWYPLLRGCSVVTQPSPLETKKIIDSIREEKATVMVGAPTFIRPFLKKATKEDLASLHLVVTGAEKLPMDLYEAFLQQFGIEILQGYGLTETTPASNINQYDPPVPHAHADEQPGKRTGSVGRLLPGMSARIMDPDTGAEMPLTATGMLWMRGANVFPGYLKDPEKTAAALKGQWFVTGDLGRFDEDGFLYIEGRLSRFSKIGGEMVPHGTVELRCAELFGWDQNEGPTVAVAGVPDATKGEAIVLLTTHEVTPEQLRAKLLEAGLPNLWIPKIVRKVEKIPMLGTGKLDLKGVRNLAIELTKDGQG